MVCNLVNKKDKGSKNIPAGLKTLIIWGQTDAHWWTFPLFSPFVMCDNVGCGDPRVKGSFGVGGTVDKV